MRKWLTISTIIHLVLFLVLWLGFPRLPRPLPTPQKIIPVEIAELAKVTATNKPPAPKPPEPKKEPPKPEPPKPPPPAKAEVKPPSEKPPEPKKPEPPKPEEKPEPTPLPKPKPKPPEPKKAEPPKADPLASVLKNVSKLKPQEKPLEEAPPQKEPAPAQPSPQVPVTADRLTSSEEDALRRQLAQCWNVPIGARDVEKIAVDIYISVNPDRTVKEAVVVDQARMNTDPFFRTIAESALRALYNPRCSPLALPPEKYQEWQDTLITFNPKDMF
jgi:hypothetical protein